MTLSVESRNFLRSLQLIYSLSQIGTEHFILCPGSRSAPLAIAAGELFKKGLIKLYNSIDERSAGFHALGISSACDKLAVVITTSGTAVANLLPAAVEADKACNKILFITADRPIRLKDCGANQTVNQEDFLISVCRNKLNTNLKGLHLIKDKEIEKILINIININNSFAGPIHLNVPFEKPLIINFIERKKILKTFESSYLKKNDLNLKKILVKPKINKLDKKFTNLDFSKTGIIIVGPYRGLNKDLSKFNRSIEKIQGITGWPIFADPISGVSSSQRGLIENWELIIANKISCIKCNQLLRLGPMSSSTYLEEFLKRFKGQQYLIKENDLRNQDPTKKSIEYSSGLSQFLNCILSRKLDNYTSKKSLIPLTKNLIKEGKRISNILETTFSTKESITECSLGYLIPKIWPEKYPIMLSASSPIRDWLTYSGNQILNRRCFSFRGASGIDGTLSLALGISRITDPLLLVTGDLAFLHDINGFLIEKSKKLNLTIIVIDNNGGNIFNRLHKNNIPEKDIKNLFIMPKKLSWDNLINAYGLPYRSLDNLNNLKESLEWSLSLQKSVIIRVRIDVEYEFLERKRISNIINEIN